MSNGNSLINLGDISKPATVLIERISDAVGGVFKPYQVRRMAQAEADAEKIREAARLEITDLQRRAFQRFIHEEAKKQENIENITRFAIPEVGEDARPQDLQDDWITNFFDKCRLISDGDMQRLWAKLLAGEANSPGKYTKRTVSLLSSLDKADANLFKGLCSFGWLVFDNVLLLVYDVRHEIYTKAGLTFLTLTHLNDIGLIRFESISTFSSQGIAQKILLHYYGTPVTVEFQQPKNNSFQVGHAFLSKAGQELAPICGSGPHPGFLEYVVDKWRNAGMKVDILDRTRIEAAKAVSGTSSENKQSAPN